MRHKWNKEERKMTDGRSYYVTMCMICGQVKEKAWTGYIYFNKGYDPVKNNTGDIGTFFYAAGNCNKPHAG
jgi:hypothetical protein